MLCIIHVVTHKRHERISLPSTFFTRWISEISWNTFSRGGLGWAGSKMVAGLNCILWHLPLWQDPFMCSTCHTDWRNILALGEGEINPDSARMFRAPHMLTCLYSYGLRLLPAAHPKIMCKAFQGVTDYLFPFLPGFCGTQMQGCCLFQNSSGERCPPPSFLRVVEYLGKWWGNALLELDRYSTWVLSFKAQAERRAKTIFPPCMQTW